MCKKYHITVGSNVDLILILTGNGDYSVQKDEKFKEIFEQVENFKKYIN